MNSREELPIPIRHSWPLWEQSRHFELGHILSSAVTDLIQPSEVGRLGLHHAGCWECDLSDNSLIWSGGVFDIFGLPRGIAVSRTEAVSFYCADSYVKMERLRSYAIRHKRGFTLDVDIRTASREPRRMRLIAAPLCDGNRVTRLTGLKLII